MSSADAAARVNILRPRRSTGVIPSVSTTAANVVQERTAQSQSTKAPATHWVRLTTTVPISSKFLSAWSAFFPDSTLRRSFRAAVTSMLPLRSRTTDRSGDDTPPRMQKGELLPSLGFRAAWEQLNGLVAPLYEFKRSSDTPTSTASFTERSSSETSTSDTQPDPSGPFRVTPLLRLAVLRIRP
jgi:hypothetical protein